MEVGHFLTHSLSVWILVVSGRLYLFSVVTIDIYRSRTSLFNESYELFNVSCH